MPIVGLVVIIGIIAFVIFASKRRNRAKMGERPLKNYDS